MRSATSRQGALAHRRVGVRRISFRLDGNGALHAEGPTTRIFDDVCLQAVKDAVSALWPSTGLPIPLSYLNNKEMKCPNY